MTQAFAGGKKYQRKGEKYIFQGKYKLNSTSKYGDSGYLFKKEGTDEVELFTESLFCKEFIPCEMELGDEVLAISMGKILCRFRVTSINGDKVYLSKDGVHSGLCLSKEIPSNCILSPIKQPSDLSRINCLEYILVTTALDTRINNIWLLGKLNSEIQKLSKDVTFAIRNMPEDKLDEFRINEVIKKIDEIRQNILTK